MLRIAEAREARGWTQERLAQAIGTTQQTIQRWETGAIDPKVSKIEAISKALGITMTFLLGIDLLDSNQSPKSEPDLSPSERRLIGRYRACNAQGRAEIESFAEYQVARHPLNQGAAEAV